MLLEHFFFQIIFLIFNAFQINKNIEIKEKLLDFLFYRATYDSLNRSLINKLIYQKQVVSSFLLTFTKKFF